MPTFDETPCPQRRGGLPCIRAFTDPICITCRRDLPLTHPTTVDLPPALRARAGLPEMAAAVSDWFARDTIGQDILQSRIAARRPLIASLPALQAQLSARHDLPMRVIADILDEVVPMLDLLTRLQQVVDEAKDGSAMAWLTAFADVRDTLYPDTEVARICRENNARRAERDAAAAAGEREAWDLSDIPEAARCDVCGATLAEVRGHSMNHGTVTGTVCLHCNAGSMVLEDDGEVL